MAVAVRFALITMAHQRNRLAPSTQLLKQPQRELLTVILDGLIAFVDASSLQVLSDTEAELGPRNLLAANIASNFSLGARFAIYIS
jgi:hypothetical protein